MSHVSSSFRQTLKPTAINLGITFHSQLNFTPHVNPLIKLLIKLLSWLRKVSSCLCLFTSRLHTVTWLQLVQNAISRTLTNHRVHITQSLASPPWLTANFRADLKIILIALKAQNRLSLVVLRNTRPLTPKRVIWDLLRFFQGQGWRQSKGAFSIRVPLLWNSLPEKKRLNIWSAIAYRHVLSYL